MRSSSDDQYDPVAGLEHRTVVGKRGIAGSGHSGEEARVQVLFSVSARPSGSQSATSVPLPRSLAALNFPAEEDGKLPGDRESQPRSSVAPVDRAVGLLEASKMTACFSFAIPIPVSRTEKETPPSDWEKSTSISPCR